MWRGGGSRQIKYSISKEIDSVCLVNYEYGNFVLNSGEVVDERNLEYLNMTGIFKAEDRICFDNINGKITMIIKRDFGESLVTIEKP